MEYLNKKEINTLLNYFEELHIEDEEGELTTETNLTKIKDAKEFVNLFMDLAYDFPGFISACGRVFLLKFRPQIISEILMEASERNMELPYWQYVETHK